MKRKNIFKTFLIKKSWPKPGLNLTGSCSYYSARQLYLVYRPRLLLRRPTNLQLVSCSFVYNEKLTARFQFSTRALLSGSRRRVSLRSTLSNLIIVVIDTFCSTDPPGSVSYSVIIVELVIICCKEPISLYILNNLRISLSQDCLIHDLLW